MSNDLTGKQQAFINAYVQCLNATESARKAGYKGSDASLAQIGYENLRKLEIRSEIDRIMRESSMPADEVVFRLAQHASIDLSPFMDSFGGMVTLNIKAVKEAGLGHLIKKIRNTENGPTIEFYDAQSALDKLARIHSLYKDTVTHSGEVSLKWEDVMRRSDSTD